ncbi:hypothetical protein MTO96_017630 [Rhipicephalus appendiculatus]
MVQLPMSQHFTDRRHTDRRPYGQAPNAPALNAQAPSSQPPYGEAAFGEVPHEAAPNAQAPYGEAAYGETPYAVAPNAQAPYGETPYFVASNAQASYGQTPNAQTPYAQTPYAEIPYGQTLYGQTPYAQVSNAQAPYGQAPYLQAPHGEWPYGEQNQQFDYVPVAVGRSVWMTVTMVSTAVLIVIGIVVGTLVFTHKTGHSPSTTVSQEITEVSVPALGVTLAPPTRSPSPPTLAPPTRSPSPSTVTEYTPAKVDRQPLVCIMGYYFTSAQHFPPDGICDYIFYDSLYLEGGDRLTDHRYSDHLDIFLNEKPAYQNTTLGLGFSFNFIAMAEQDLKDVGPGALAGFWNQGVFHAGILDTPTKPTRDEMKAAIASFKSINQVVDYVRNRGETAITVITVPQPHLEWAFSFAEDFRELNFTPTLLISNGHYQDEGERDGDCFIMPPTRHPEDIPPPEVQRVYNFDVSSPMYQLRSLYANGTDTRGLLGVTLEGRNSKTESGDKVDIYKRCVSGYTGFNRYVALTAVKNLDPSVPFGLAVYNVDSDDYNNTCASVNKYGAFSRLKELKKLLDFFKANYRGAIFG